MEAVCHRALVYTLGSVVYSTEGEGGRGFALLCQISRGDPRPCEHFNEKFCFTPVYLIHDYSVWQTFAAHL